MVKGLVAFGMLVNVAVRSGADWRLNPALVQFSTS